jgi:hypothetical protein
MDRQLYAEQGTMDVRWNFFVGAAILAGGLLLKFGAPVEAIGAGIGLAALWRWKGANVRLPRRNPREPK